MIFRFFLHSFLCMIYKLHSKKKNISVSLVRFRYKKLNMSYFSMFRIKQIIRHLLC